MLQPEGFEKKEQDLQIGQILIRSQRCIKRCYNRFDFFIISLRCNKLHSDACACCNKFEGNKFIVVLLYVDVMLVSCPNNNHVKELKSQFVREFDTKDKGWQTKF